jgi:hypothetical protein
MSTTFVPAKNLSEQQRAQIARAVSAWRSEHDVPGIAVAVGRDGEVWSIGSGKADLSTTAIRAITVARCRMALILQASMSSRVATAASDIFGQAR